MSLDVSGWVRAALVNWAGMNGDVVIGTSEGVHTIRRRDGEILAKVAVDPPSVEELQKALAEACDVAIWMSGSPSFSPGGEAHEGWLKQRERLFAALAMLPAQELGALRDES